MKCIYIGSGEDRYDDCLRLDVRESVKPDIVWDLEKLPLPFKDEEFDLIYAKDVVENITWRKTEALLNELFRILKHGGKIYIQVPDLEAIAKKAIFNPDNCLGDMCGWKLISYWIYGGQDYPENIHKAGFTISTLSKLLQQIGFQLEEIKNDDGTNIQCWAKKP